MRNYFDYDLDAVVLLRAQAQNEARIKLDLVTYAKKTNDVCGLKLKLHRCTAYIKCDMN